MKICLNQVKIQYNATNSYGTMLKIHTILEQGHKNIITNMLCLGVYLGLLGYIDMNNSKQSQYNIDIIQIKFLPFALYLSSLRDQLFSLITHICC